MSGPRIFFAGVGGTGKTTLLDTLADALRLPVFPSVVRPFLQSNGFRTQGDLDALPPESRMHVQLKLAQHYVVEVTRYCNENPRGMVMDRSVYDHAGYTLLSNLDAPPDLIAALNAAFYQFEALQPIIVYFPYPPAWYRADKMQDGFRNIRPAHDTALDGLICRWLATRDRNNRNLMISLSDSDSPEERLQHILDELQHFI